MATESAGRLSELRKELALLRAVPCRIQHEKVVGILFNAVLSSDAEEESARYERKGFCSHEFRARQIGCGHTLARYKLHDALKELEKLEGIDRREIGRMQAEWNALDGEIGQLDHRKGEADRIHATLLHQSTTGAVASGEIEGIEKEIEEIVREHSACVDRLNRLHEEIMGYMDRAVSSEQ